MGRVIATDSVRTERARLKKGMALAIRELMRQREVDDSARDLIAYILLSLDRITETIDLSVEAWEKRDYWLKADQFRREWSWASILAERIRPKVLAQDVAGLIPDLVSLGQALSDTTVSEHHRLGKPWVGSWERLISESRER